MRIIGKDELGIKLCEYCQVSHYGEIPFEYTPDNFSTVCENKYCDDAYSNYLENLNVCKEEVS